MHGKKIKEYRKKLGLTQEKLGAALGVRGNTVARWENDVVQPDSWTMLELALKQLVLQNNADNSRKLFDENYREINESIAQTKQMLDELENAEPLLRFTPRAIRKREIQLQP